MILGTSTPMDGMVSRSCFVQTPWSGTWGGRQNYRTFTKIPMDEAMREESQEDETA